MRPQLLLQLVDIRWELLSDSFCDDTDSEPAANDGDGFDIEHIAIAIDGVNIRQDANLVDVNRSVPT